MGIKFAVVSPIAGLERYASLSRIHLVLAQHMQNPEYMDFYVKMRERGDEIILDNGAYENLNPLEEGAFWDCILWLKPTVAVLPDYLLQDPRKTVSASLRFLDKYVGRADCQWMFVPQAERGKRDHIAWALQAVLGDIRVGQYIGWIGLPRALATHFDNWRPALAAALKGDFPHLKIHALGMADGSVEELRACEAVGVYSIDSSAPVWRGLHSLSISDLEDRKTWEEVGSPMDLDKTTEEIIRNTNGMVSQNLKEVGVHEKTNPGR